jgi:hypothetical protein
MLNIMHFYCLIFGTNLCPYNFFHYFLDFFVSFWKGVCLDTCIFFKFCKDSFYFMYKWFWVFLFASVSGLDCLEAAIVLSVCAFMFFLEFRTAFSPHRLSLRWYALIARHRALEGTYITKDGGRRMVVAGGKQSGKEAKGLLMRKCNDAGKPTSRFSRSRLQACYPRSLLFAFDHVKVHLDCNKLQCLLHFPSGTSVFPINKSFISM